MLDRYTVTEIGNERELDHHLALIPFLDILDRKYIIGLLDSSTRQIILTSGDNRLLCRRGEKTYYLEYKNGKEL